jgi:natural product precursor
MKKLKLEGKLNLNKETISQLNKLQMDNLKGGDPYTWVMTCSNMSNLGPCYSMGTSCLPDSASCNVNSCPQAGSCPTLC